MLAIVCQYARANAIAAIPNRHSRPWPLLQCPHGRSEHARDFFHVAATPKGD